MSTVLCDLGAWITFASRAPMTPIPKEEADRVLAGATCTAAQVAAVRQARWFWSATPLARQLAGLPSSRDVPVDLVVPLARRAHGVKGARAHQCPVRSLEDGMLCRVGGSAVGEDDVYVVAPPLYLLMRARFLGVAPLLAVATTLCGSYALRPDLDQRVVKARPLADPATLAGFAGRLPSNVTKAAHLRSALSCLAEGSSRSPMETALAVMLALPVRHGGMGFPAPRLNAPVELGPDARRVLGGTTQIIVDLLWDGAAVGVEYDSDEHHSEASRRRADERRRLAAELVGVELVPWTRSVVTDETAFSLACERLAGRLGAGFSWDTRHLEARRRVRSQMLSSHLFW